MTLSGGPAGVRRWLEERPGFTKLLLVIDQFEEAFVDPDPDRCAELLASISAVVASTAPATVVVTMRDEFFSQFKQQAPSLSRELEDGLRNVPSTLTKEELTEIVAEPARLVGVDFERGLVEQIVKDAVAAAPGVEDGTAASTVLPLLEFTLAQLWDKRSDGGMTHRGYEAVGEVTGGIASWAEGALDRMGEAALPTVRTVFSGLVHLGDERQGIPDNRWRRPLGSLARQPDELPQVTEVVRRLADERLVVTSYDRDGGTELVELIHDVLVREWDRLRRWLDEDRRFLTWQQELERRRQRWEEDSADGGGRDTGKLLRGRDLDYALHLEDELAARLTDDQRTFIADSQEQQRRSQRLRRYAVTGLAILTVIALVAAAIAFVGFVQARNETAHALASARQTIAVHLISDADGILAGKTGGGDIQAFQKLLAAHALAGVTADGGMLDAVIQRFPMAKMADAGGIVTSVAVSRDGHRVATGAGNNVRIWSAGTGQPLVPPMTGHTQMIESVAFSPDAHRLASVSFDRTVRLWNADTGQPIGQPLAFGGGGELLGMADAPTFATGNQVAFTPDGHRLATGSGGTVMIWNADTGQPINESPTGYTGRVQTEALSPDLHRFATADQDYPYLVRLWNADTGAPIGQPLAGHTGEVHALAFSPDGHSLATGNGDNTIRLWNVDTGQPIGNPLTGHTGGVLSVAFNPDGHRLASGSADKTVRLWDVDTGQSIRPPLSGHHSVVTSVAFCSDGQLASGSPDGMLRLWDLTVGLPLVAGRQVAAAAFTADGRGLAAASEGGIQSWRIDTGQSIGPPDSVWIYNDAVFSPDGHRVATLADGNDNTVTVYNADTGHTLGTPLTGHTTLVTGLAFSPDGHRLAAAADDKTVRVWNVETGQPIGQPLTAQTDFNSVAFSPDGHRLATGSYDNTVRLWNADIGQPIGGPLTGHTDLVTSVAFSPNGHMLASGSQDGTARLWNADTGQPIGGPLTGHTQEVSTVAFSPDGRRLATGGGDNTVRLWNPETGQPFGDPIPDYGDAPDYVTTVAFSPDGRRIAIASLDSSIWLWPTSATPDMLCARLTTNMSPQQWDRWVSPDPRVAPYKKSCPDLPPD